MFMLRLNEKILYVGKKKGSMGGVYFNEVKVCCITANALLIITPVKDYISFPLNERKTVIITELVNELDLLTTHPDILDMEEQFNSVTAEGI